MKTTVSWQSAVVALFEKASSRLSNDAKQLHESVSWLRRIEPPVATRTGSSSQDGTRPVTLGSHLY